jgi:hypothetical protein
MICDVFQSGYGGYIEVITCKAIQPKDIQEVMRRFGQNIGPFASQHVCSLLIGFFFILIL